MYSPISPATVTPSSVRVVQNNYKNAVTMNGAINLTETNMLCRTNILKYVYRNVYSVRIIRYTEIYS
jgi:hypothetical protein